MCSFLLQVPLLSILLIYSTRAGWNFFFFQSKLGRQMVFRRYRCDSFHCLFNGALLASKALLFSNEKIVIFAGTVEKQAAMQEEGDLELYVCSNEGACFINQSWRLPELSSPLSSSGFAHGAAWAAVGQSSAIPVSAEAFQRAHGLFCWYRRGGRGWGKAVGSLGMASECLMRGQYGGCGPVPSLPRGGVGSRLSEPVGTQCTIQILVCWEGSEQHYIYIYIYLAMWVFFVGCIGFFFVCVFFPLIQLRSLEQQKKCSFIQCQENAVIYQGWKWQCCFRMADNRSFEIRNLGLAQRWRAQQKRCSSTPLQSISGQSHGDVTAHLRRSCPSSCCLQQSWVSAFAVGALCY